MIKSVTLGEEIIITAGNKVGLLADIAMTLASQGINIESVVGYEVDDMAKLMMVTNANIRIIDMLKKKKYASVKEVEVVIVDISNNPGALKVVTTELANNKIDIRHIYVTSPSDGTGSKMILLTSDNETTMEVLQKYVPEK